MLRSVIRRSRSYPARRAHRRRARAFEAFGADAVLDEPRLLTRPERMTIGPRTRIRAGARLEVVPQTGGWRGAATGRLAIGADVRVEDFVTIAAAESVTIGDGAAIASFSYITDHDHGSPAPDQAILDAPLTVAPTTIGRGAWIGHAAIILKGVTIGDRAIVGAGSVVTRDVAPGQTVAGVPARALRG